MEHVNQNLELTMSIPCRNCLKIIGAPDDLYPYGQIEGSSGTPTSIPSASGGTVVLSQMVRYMGGTPALPTDPTQPAWAYDPTGRLPSLGWNVQLQQWR